MLSACAALTPVPRPAAQVAGDAASAPFELLGRVVVRFDDRAFSSMVRWQHSAALDEIWLMSPLGQTLAYIRGEPETATLTTAEQTQYYADSIENLTRRALGWELPLARLKYWVRGEVAPGGAPAYVERDEARHLVVLAQDGWRAVLTRYPPGEFGGLPRRLDLASGTSEIRLVIDSWRFGEETP